jgi:ribonuclease P protein component
VLPAGNRLRRRRDFAIAVRRGRRAVRPSIVVHLKGDPVGTEPSRIGFVVARSVGGAVTRNAIRRRLRHLMRARLDLLPPGALLVVRATPAATGVSNAQLASDLDSALTRVLADRSWSRPRSRCGSQA